MASGAGVSGQICRQDGGRRETSTLEQRPGQTRLISSGLLGNRQGAWSNLLNSASSISLFFFLCLSRLLTFSLRAAAFPICRYLSHPLKALISHPHSPHSLSAPPPLQSAILSSLSLSLCTCVSACVHVCLHVRVCVCPSQTSDSVSSRAVQQCHPHIFHTNPWVPPSGRPDLL